MLQIPSCPGSVLQSFWTPLCHSASPFTLIHPLILESGQCARSAGAAPVLHHHTDCRPPPSPHPDNNTPCAYSALLPAPATSFFSLRTSPHSYPSSQQFKSASHISKIRLSKQVRLPSPANPCKAHTRELRNSKHCKLDSRKTILNHEPFVRLELFRYTQMITDLPAIAAVQPATSHRDFTHSYATNELNIADRSVMPPLRYSCTRNRHANAAMLRHVRHSTGGLRE